MVEGKVINFPVKPPMNMEQAKALFSRECTIFSTSGGVPLARIVELFGEEPAWYATHLDKAGEAKYSNVFGIGSYQCCYLTWKGFLQAVTCANVMYIAQRHPDGASLFRTSETPKRK